ncbi:MAG TPA: LCP family protein [Trebonia sp.]|jgi:LCP family protein required for cell wall assembly
MSDEDPFKNWYAKEQPPPADATQDISVSSRMPPPNGDQGDAPRRAWPQQPPPSSGPGGSSRGGNGRYAANDGYGQTVGYGANSGYGNAGYGQGGYTGAPPRTATPPPRGGRRWRFWGQPGRHGRRIALIIGIVVIVLIAGVGGTYFWINGKLNRTVALPSTTATSAGTNWLIAGSDQRTGISRTERAQLHLGSDGADASDSLMLLHFGTTGKPVLISIPRDSYVDIPGHGNDKINAALAIGGPTLLIQTVESVTGLKINHYMGIGFGGLASVVNTVGGVRICVTTAIQPDSDSGFKGLAAGCHNLSGTQAIAFVRDRHSFATSDLQRIQDQRAFLSALLSKATSPGVYLNPFTALPFASASASAIAVDKDSSLYDLLRAAQALRGPVSGTVPIANANYQTSSGDAVLWDRTKALELFNALKAGKAVPAGLLSGTKVG